jgi:hypothetical protein
MDAGVELREGRLGAGHVIGGARVEDPSYGGAVSVGAEYGPDTNQ